MLAAIALAVPLGNAHAFFINEDSFHTMTVQHS
jgi:hypothetical protein